MAGMCVGNACEFTPGQPAGGGSISQAAFQKNVLESDRPVVVMFEAPGRCGRCRAAMPTLRELQRETRARVVQINVDENPDLARDYKVGPLPHFVLFEGGKAVAQERPELIPGEARRRRFDAEAQLGRIFGQLS